MPSETTFFEGFFATSTQRLPSLLRFARLAFNKGFRFLEKILGFCIRGPFGIFHDLAQAGEGGGGLGFLAELMVRHGQEGQIGGNRSLRCPCFQNAAPTARKCRVRPLIGLFERHADGGARL